MFLDDSGQGTQSLVSIPRTWERGSHVGFQHDDGTSCCVSRRILVRRSADEIIFRKNLVGIKPLGALALSG